jgi:sarcosine oxidase
MMACLNMPTGAKVYDAIVVGLGGAGSAALYHLSAKGLHVLGIEQFQSIPHDRGACRQ